MSNIFTHYIYVWKREHWKDFKTSRRFFRRKENLSENLFWNLSVSRVQMLHVDFYSLRATFCDERGFSACFAVSWSLFYRVVLTRIYRYSASSSTRDMDPPLSHCEKISNRPRQRPFHTRLHNGCLHSTVCGVYKATIYLCTYVYIIPIWRETAFMHTVESYRAEAYVSWSRNRNSVEYVHVYSAHYK